MPRASNDIVADETPEADSKKKKTRKQYTTFAEARKALGTKYGDVMFDKSEPDMIPTRFWRLGMMLGGGIPKGRILELWGPPGGWKTTEGLVLAADIQAFDPDRHVFFVDNEQTYPEKYALRHGLVLSDDEVVRPRYLEQGYDAALDVMSSGEVSAVMVDSVVSIATSDEVNAESLVKDLIADRARKLTQFLYAAVGLAREKGTTLIMINQMRARIGGNPHGSTELRPGGKTFEHLASLILRCSATQEGAKMSIVKNKLTGRRREFTYNTTEGEGLDLSHEFLDFLVSLNVVTQNGGHYRFGKNNSKHGRDLAAAFANENKEALLPVAMEEYTKLKTAWSVGVTIEADAGEEDGAAVDGANAEA